MKKRKLPKGVSKTPNGKYTAVIYYNCERHHLGTYANEKKASQAYQKAKKENKERKKLLDDEAKSYVLPIKNLNEKNNPLLVQNQWTKIGLSKDQKIAIEMVKARKNKSQNNYHLGLDLDYSKRKMIQKLRIGKEVPKFYREFARDVLI